MSEFIALCVVIASLLVLPQRAVASNKTVTVVVLAERRSAPDGVVPAVGARIDVVLEEGTAHTAFTDQNGQAVIVYPESRSFVIAAIAGPAQSKRTNRFYGRIDQVVSVFMGAEPAYGPDPTGSLHSTIVNAAKGAERGLPRSFRKQFEGSQIDVEVAKAVRSGGMSDAHGRECKAALARIRSAPLLGEPAPKPRGAGPCIRPVCIPRHTCRRR